MWIKELKEWPAEAPPSPGTSSTNEATPSGASDSAPATPEPGTSVPDDQQLTDFEDTAADGLAADEWSKLADAEPEGEDEGLPADPTKVPAVQPQSQPQQPPAQQPPAQEPPAQQPPAQPATPAEPQPAQPAPVQPAPPPAQQPAPTKTAEQIQQEQLAAEQNYLQSLEGLYKIPETEAAQLQTEPEVVLSKLAAKLHAEVRREVLREVHQNLPQSVHAIAEATRRESESKQAFYTRWPELAQYEQQVLTVGRMFREANPTATPEQALETVGAMTYMALGKPVPGAPQAPGAPPLAAPPARPPAPAGFRPAMPGGGGAAPAPKETNMWSGMAEDFLNEDRGA